MGTEVADTEAAEIKDTAAPEPTAETIEREAEETVEEGSAAVEDEESSASAEDEISEDDEEEKEEEEDPERLSELEILPGKTAYINFYYTIDPEIEGMKDQKVDFSFAYTLEDEEGKQTKNTLRETFRYAVDALNLMTVTAGGEKGYVETGKEDEMLLEFDLGLMREVLEEAIEEELEKTENGDASAAEAKRASASELLVGWEDENGERPLGKKDPAVIKNLKCEVETFGVKLDKFKAIPVKDDDNFGTSLKCSFYVSRKTLPGTYYGRVNASYKIKGKSFHTTQGFKVVVKQETGEMELVGKIGDSEIIMTGPVSSFPKADELSLKVSEITQEQQEKVDEALQKKAEEEGTEISQYKALDIKLMADGVETEPEGDVQVRFKNVNLEKVDEKNEAEQEKAEEQSIVKKAVRKVMSLFSAGSEEDVAAVAETGTEGEEESKAKDAENVKAEGSEEAAGETGETAENSENIKVLHLDEDAIVANEMKSEVQDNGDVVMDTDHFSIYIVVNVPDEVKDVQLTVNHYATVKKYYYEAVKSDGTFVPVEKRENGTFFYSDGREATDAVFFQLAETNRAITEDGKDYLKIGSNVNKKYDTEEVQIYTSDTETVLNGSGTGEDLMFSLDKWSKVSAAGKYKVDYIKVRNKYYDEKIKKREINGFTVDNGCAVFKSTDNQQEVVHLSAGSNTVDIYYEPISNVEIKGNVGFHDYNVSIEDTPKDNNEAAKRRTTDEKNNVIQTEKNIRTDRVGINNPHLWMDKGEPLPHSLTKTENRIGVGIWNTGSYDSENVHTDTTSIGHKYLRQHVFRAAPAIKGIPDSFLKNGNITFDLETRADITIEKDPDTFGRNNTYNRENNVKIEPGLFYPGDIYTVETYDESGSNSEILKDSTGEGTYIAKKYLTNYQLGFLRTGDTYVLSNVYRNGTSVLPDLNNLKKSSNYGPLYSNLFWPLDGDNYCGKDGNEAIKGKNRDHEFGRNYGFGSNDEADPDHGTTEKNNPTKAHNWFFGMRYDFTFTMGDYIGPMDYYFRGDDDFWLYIDGQLVEDVELGGVHIAKAAYVDLRKWMTDKGKLEYDENGNLINPNKEHQMTVFFMERGGTGSCCYMQFTVPNARSMELPGSETTTKSVRKVWIDEQGDSYRRPIEVVLKQDNKEFATATLEEPDWTKTWVNLPKNSKIGEAGEHIYTVEEVSEVPGYIQVDSETSGNTDFVITNVRSVKIPVKKVWAGDEDRVAQRPEIQVQLYKKFGDLLESSNTNESTVPLSLNDEIDISSMDEEVNEFDEIEGMDEEQEDIADSSENVDETTDEIPNDSNQDNSSIEDEHPFVFPTGEGWEPVPEKKGEQNYGKITLNAANNWEYTWEMPLYEKDKNGYWRKVIYTVQELNGDWMIPEKSPDGWYEVSYSGDAMNGGVTITNTFKEGISGEIFISKECVGNSEEATFEFEIKEGNWNADSKEFTENTSSSLQGTNITVKNAEVTNGKIVVAYKITDIEKGFTEGSSQIERWYKISEKKGSENFIYDKTFYIVKMILQKNSDGTYTAEWDKQNVYKDGEPYKLGKESQLPFKNYKSVNLELEKKVDSNSQNHKDKEFTFTTTIWKDNVVFDTVEVKLKADGKIIIPVPVGSTVTIEEKEESHAGYSVKFEVNGVETKGHTVSIDVPSNGPTPTVAVTCTNTPGAVLPDTGGPGLLMMSRLGWMLLLLALLMAGMEIQFYGERRNRKTANVQREDTRGFDPDDY